MPVDPASLRIIQFPDPALRLPGVALERIDDEVRAVAARMLELMRAEEGIGLAAPQVGLAWRLFVAHVPHRDGDEPGDDAVRWLEQPTAFVNPVLGPFAGASEPWDEGCLSLPDIRGDVLRPPVVTVRALGLDGREFSIRCGGLLARCVQHETDHLDGVLIIDRMTQMSRLKNRLAVRDLERSAERR